MSSSAIPVEQVSRFVTRLAIVIAVLVTLAPALGYLAFAWQDATEGLEHHSQIQSTLVSRYVTRNPEVWRDTHERLQETLTGFSMPDQRTTVIDNAQQTIGKLGPASLKTPVLSRQAPFYEFGVVAGMVRVESSLEKTINTASIIFILSGMLGTLVFAPMRRIPLAALTDSVRRLVRSEERFRRLTELSSDWYWEQDQHQRFISMSDGAKHSGFAVDAALGHRLKEIATGISLEAWADHQHKLDQRESFRDFDCAVRAITGDEIWLSVSGAPMFDDRGNFTGYHGTARDQTLRHRTESILRNQKELMNEMVERRTAELRAALERVEK